MPGSPGERPSIRQTLDKMENISQSTVASTWCTHQFPFWANILCMCVCVLAGNLVIYQVHFFTFPVPEVSPGGRAAEGQQTAGLGGAAAREAAQHKSPNITLKIAPSFLHWTDWGTLAFFFLRVTDRTFLPLPHFAWNENIALATREGALVTHRCPHSGGLSGGHGQYTAASWTPALCDETWCVCGHHNDNRNGEIRGPRITRVNAYHEWEVFMIVVWESCTCNSVCDIFVWLGRCVRT